jgi:MFS family permease
VDADARSGGGSEGAGAGVAAGERRSGARSVVPLVTGWQLAASTCYYALFAATPFVREAFGLSRLLVGVVVTTLTLGYTLGLFPIGAAVDGFGEKRRVAGRDGHGGDARARQGVAMGVKQVGFTAGSGLSALLVVTAAPLVATWHAGFLAAGAFAGVTVVAFAVAYPAGSGSGRLALPDLRGFSAGRAYPAPLAAGFFLGAALFTTTGYTTLYLTESVRTGTALAGVGFAAMRLLGSAGRVAGGGVAERLTARGVPQARGAATALVGMAVVGAACLGVLAAWTPPPLLALVVLGVVGATVLGFTGLYYTCVAGLVGEGKLGAATAGGQAALNAGALLAPPAFGWLVDFRSYEAGWLLLAACMALSVVLLAGVRRWTGPGARSVGRPAAETAGS